MTKTKSHWRTAAITLVSIAAACGPAGDHPGISLAPETEGQALCPGGATLQGVDVSVYQGSINWGQAAGAGIAWAYAKATEGDGSGCGWADQDSQFQANWSGMKNAGVTRGAYHFFHPSCNGTSQADYYLAMVGALGAGDLPPMLDWEVSDGVSGTVAGQNAQAFVNEILAKTGMLTIIYTSPGLWSGFGVPQSFAAELLWVADWTFSTTSCPALPSGWNNFAFWQWSDGASGTGSVPGIPATVDRDVFNGDAALLSQLTNGNPGGGGPVAPSCTYALGHPVGAGSKRAPGCAAGGPPALPAAPSACGSIPIGQALGPGQQVLSCDSRFQLVMQGDGNVVLYEHGEALWNTVTAGTTGTMFVMQGDGNLVLYDSGSCPLWASNTGGNPGATFAVQSDGNLVVYSPAGKPLWSSGSGPIPSVPTQCGTFAAGTGLGPGDSVTSCQACFNLVMQTDGNLVLYQGSKALWDTATNGQDGQAMVMQGDGNFVLYSNAGCPLWNAGTEGNAGAFLAVQDDGNLVVYNSSNKPLWASNTVACAGGCSCLPPAGSSSSSGGAASSSSSSGGSSSGSSSGDSSTKSGSSSSSSGTSSSEASGSSGGKGGSGSGGGSSSGTATSSHNGSSSSGSTTTKKGSSGNSSSGTSQGNEGSAPPASGAGDAGQPTPIGLVTGGCSTGGSHSDLSIAALLGIALAARRRRL